MRHRRFRPAFDRLDLRIAPSGTAPAPSTSLGQNQTYNPDGYSGTTGDPDMDVNVDGTMSVCSGDQSGYDPTNPGVDPGN